MHRVPLPILFVDIASPEGRTAWDRLQAGVGNGLLTAVLDTPDTQGTMSNIMEIQEHPQAPVADMVNARNALDLLVFAWRALFEEVMNRRWNLVENPYARITVVRGAIVLHQDPLGWMVDAHAADIADGTPLDSPTCAVLVPLPTSGHALLATAAQPFALAHVGLLNADLTRVAMEEGHTAITPLAWAVAPALPSPGNTLRA